MGRSRFSTASSFSTSREFRLKNKILLTFERRFQSRIRKLQRPPFSKISRVTSLKMAFASRDPRSTIVLCDKNGIN